ncbi:hypothetical protein [Jatrophihabitans sp.]|uniref:hypothetical protein n=1 Tax=Jatrophihabitans sp. TaxID=1932789 RepID=UPI002C021258|nr:hypothetical protein [Jatrophihabitans sp.]
MARRPASGTRGRSGYRMLLATLLAALALPLAGCGSGRTGAGEVVTPRGEPAAALARWRSFPADADPRPLVLVYGLVRDPSSGFTGSGDKDAYGAGAFDVAVTLPAGPATVDGYPVVPAREAVDRLRATAWPDSTSTTRLRIVSATLGRVEFGTDRGLRRLPAWRFGIDGVRDPAWVLAVDSPALWPYQPDWAQNPNSLGAALQPDGRTVSYDFTGGPDNPGPCGAQYAASAKESATAVVIEVRQVGKQQAEPQPEGDVVVACEAMGYRRTVTVQLAAPLGGRVLLTADGAPVSVTSS